MKKMIFLALSLLFSSAVCVFSQTTIDVSNPGVSGPGWNYADSVITITDGADVTLTCSTDSNRVVVASGATATITLQDVEINNNAGDGASAMDMRGATVILKLSGNNILKNALLDVSYAACLRAPTGSTLTITSASGNNSTEGSLTVTGDSNGAGIGGGLNESGGDITIKGGTVTANGGYRGAGIGGGAGGFGGNITIEGGTVTANGGISGAGIGGGRQGDGGNITIEDGTVTANGGRSAAGIGGGWNGNGGNITIEDGTVTASGNVAAGIGAGDEGNGGNITITGGSVYAYSTGGAYDPTAIGGSDRGAGTIKITGGTVVAVVGNNNSPGIGAGSSVKTGTIEISGGIVIAGGRGIGIGNNNGATATTITGDAVVLTTGLNDPDPGGAIVSTGNVVTSTASPITATVTLNTGLTVPEGCTLIIPEGVELIIPAGQTLTDNGTIIGDGTVTGNGAIPTLYPVSYSVVDAGFANGSTVSATYNGTSLRSDSAEVSGGNDLVVTAVGNGADIYTYAWTVNDAPRPETSDTLIISNVTDAQAVVCTITGLKLVTDVMISGTPLVGETLTATVSPDSTTVVYQWKVDSIAIPGATSDSLVLTTDQRGRSITVTVTGTGNYTGEVTSPAKGPVVGSVTGVTISGTPRVGETLTATASPSGATVNYQWKADSADISGAMSRSFTLMSDQRGKRITVTVTGTENYSGEATSPATGAVVESVTGVTISGTAEVGNTLTATVSPAGATVNYQWKAGGVAISGATSGSFTLTDAQANKQITVTVTGKGNYTGVVTSSVTGVVVARFGANLIWTLSNGVLTISGTGEMSNYSTFTKSPWNPDSVTTVVIGNDVTNIGGRAFYGCGNLISATIGNSVANIGDYAFLGCSKLTSITVGNANNSYSAVDGVVFNKDKTELILFPEGKKGQYIIPESVVSIKDRAFYNCAGLTSVAIPGSVTSIEKDAFSHSGLTSVTIPASVTSIKEFAFASCIGLRSVTSLSPEPQSVNSAFNGVTISSVALYVPAGSGKAYEAANVWKGFGRIEELIRTIIPAVGAPSELVYFHGQTLHVDSPEAEQISIYSVTGTLLYKLEKPAGKADFAINRAGGILIVRGSSGWVRKIKN